MRGGSRCEVSLEKLQRSLVSITSDKERKDMSLRSGSRELEGDFTGTVEQEEHALLVRSEAIEILRFVADVLKNHT